MQELSTGKDSDVVIGVLVPEMDWTADTSLPCSCHDDTSNRSVHIRRSNGIEDQIRMVPLRLT